ncbi:uncharacterized [Tachysurus ichikawai]
MAAVEIEEFGSRHTMNAISASVILRKGYTGPSPAPSTCMASFCGLVLRYSFILEDQHNENQNEKHHEGITKG